MNILDWLKQKLFGRFNEWVQASQPPGEPFPFPKGAKLRAAEEVIIAFPEAVFQGNERIGDVILCDDDAEFGSNPDDNLLYIKMKPGMELSINKSYELVVIAEDHRPRRFEVRKP